MRFRTDVGFVTYFYTIVPLLSAPVSVIVCARHGTEDSFNPEYGNVYGNAGMTQDTRNPGAHPVPMPAAVERACDWIRRKKLEAPAAFLLEIHRPLMPLAWPAATLVGPVVAPFVGPDYYERVEALRDPALLDAVLARLSASDAAALPARAPGSPAP